MTVTIKIDTAGGYPGKSIMNHLKSRTVLASIAIILVNAAPLFDPAILRGFGVTEQQLHWVSMALGAAAWYFRVLQKQNYQMTPEQQSIVDRIQRFEDLLRQNPPPTRADEERSDIP